MKKGAEFTFYSLGYGNVHNINNDSLEYFSSRNKDGIVFEVKYKKLEFIDTDKDGNGRDISVEIKGGSYSDI